MNLYLSKFYLNLTLLTAFIFGTPLAGFSQSIWTKEPEGQAKIGIEALIPSFSDAVFIQSPSSAYYAYADIPVSEVVTLQLDLPVSYTDGGSVSKAAIGNPYAGVQLGVVSNVKVDLGVRLPLAPDNNAGLVTGEFIELYKVGPFVPHAFSAIANVHYRYEDPSGFIIRLDGGPELVAPRNSNAELFLKYGGQVLFNIEQFRVGGGVISQLIATERNLTFGERSISSFGFTGSYNFNQFDFGAFIEIPINDGINNILKDVVGINLAVDI